MAVTRGDKHTIESKKREYYSDFLTNLSRHPVTGALARTTNEAAVGQSIRNLILTNLGERLFQPTIGSNVRRTLFEPSSPFTIDNLKTYIQDTINYSESRARLIDITIDEQLDRNAIGVSITYSLINSTIPYVISLLLKRVR